MSKKRKEEKQRASTRQLIGVKEISDFSIVTYEHGELVFFLIKPSNISVLSEESIKARVYALMNVLKGMAERCVHTTAVKTLMATSEILKRE